MSASAPESNTTLREKITTFYEKLKSKGLAPNFFSRGEPASDSELYEKVAKIVNQLQFGDIAILFLESFKPISGFLGQMTYMTTFPIREVLAFAWPEFHSIGHLMIEEPNDHIDGIVQQIKKGIR